MERLSLARRFGGTIKSCLADTCYAESCLVGRCYARQFFQNLRVWTNERRAVALFGVVAASIILHGASGGDAKSCLADRCYAVSCLVDRCYARHIFQNLRVWTNEPWWRRRMDGLTRMIQISLLKMG
ncbi:Serine/threonine-protein kinase HT1 [Hordeum vulgare]|nr:Serine/threonine-protein kinase HT1 [Hordeum vulgare]